MPRPRKLDRPHRLEIQLPESLWTKLNAELYSEIEGRVPHGALSGLVAGLISDWLKSRGGGCMTRSTIPIPISEAPANG